jgi:flagellar basal body rod protein FlgC
MTAKEFLRKEDYNENSKGYVLTFQEMSDLLEEYAEKREAARLYEAEQKCIKLPKELWIRTTIIANKKNNT